MICAESFFTAELFLFFSVMYLRKNSGPILIVPLVWCVRGAGRGVQLQPGPVRNGNNLGTRYKAAQ